MKWQVILFSMQSGEAVKVFNYKNYEKAREKMFQAAQDQDKDSGYNSVRLYPIN